MINSNPAYQFHAIRNRFETYGSGEVTFLNSNHLHLNVQGITTGLASGSSTTKWLWKACEMGSYSISDCSLSNPQKLLSPILSSLSYGSTVGTGVLCRNVGYLQTIEFGAWDGTNEYSVIDSLVNKRSARAIRFSDSYRINSNASLDFEIVFDDDTFAFTGRKQQVYTLQKAGTGLREVITIPRYQIIDEVSVTNVGTLPANINGFRIYRDWVTDRKSVV